MNLFDIRQAVAQGRTVRWKSAAYRVVDGGKAGLLIRCEGNGHCIGLTHTDEVTLNGDPADFYVEPEEPRPSAALRYRGHEIADPTLAALAVLFDFATTRRQQTGNPYRFPEVRAAMQALSDAGVPVDNLPGRGVWEWVETAVAEAVQAEDEHGTHRNIALPAEDHETSPTLFDIGDSK